MMRRQLKYPCTAQNEKKKSQTNVNTEVCQSYTDLRLLETFSGVLHKKKKKIRTRAFFKEALTNYISTERL